LQTTEAQALMSSIMSGQLDGPQIAAVLVALRMKGETVKEITGFAAAMRDKAVRISPAREGLVDTCGTGGDARHTFNISTATALVAAGMGIPVAKHGNRAVSSSCGSADVLEALGVVIDLHPDDVAGLIDEVGIGFLFAPQHHPAMKHAAPVRRQLGIRTVFNLLGPLTNPAGVKRQLVGVFAAELTEPVCRVLGELGAEKAFVVHGQDGTDEISISGPTTVSELSAGRVRSFIFTPEEAGLERADIEAIAGGTAEENASHIEDILAGGGGGRRDAVLLNAGFVAVLADLAEDVTAGVELARIAIDDGSVRKLVDDLRRASRRRFKEAS
jgi:anthranilate phosphoribosyltransferase